MLGYHPHTLRYHLWFYLKEVSLFTSSCVSYLWVPGPSSSVTHRTLLRFLHVLSTQSLSTQLVCIFMIYKKTPVPSIVDSCPSLFVTFPLSDWRSPGFSDRFAFPPLMTVLLHRREVFYGVPSSTHIVTTQRPQEQSPRPTQKLSILEDRGIFFLVNLVDLK